MKLICKYCGYSVEYENGRGWFPGYCRQVEDHILKEHVKFSQTEKRSDDVILFDARIDYGYSELDSSVSLETSLTVTSEERFKPPPYSKP